jgi:hypothetical protein
LPIEFISATLAVTTGRLSAAGLLSNAATR